MPAAAGMGAGRGPVSRGDLGQHRLGSVGQPPVCRTRQHSRCLVVGARRARTPGGPGTGRPARPVVDRHRPVQRSRPVPDRRGRDPGRDGARHPGPGADRHRLVGVPPRGQPAGSPACRRRHRLRPAGRRTAAGSLGPQPAGLAWHAGDADRIVAELEASRALSGQADPALAARAQVLLANAAFLAGDLAEQERHSLLAVELARTAAGQEGLALALTSGRCPRSPERAPSLP